MSGEYNSNEISDYGILTFIVTKHSQKVHIKKLRSPETYCNNDSSRHWAMITGEYYEGDRSMICQNCYKARRKDYQKREI